MYRVSLKPSSSPFFLYFSTNWLILTDTNIVTVTCLRFDPATVYCLSRHLISTPGYKLLFKQLGNQWDWNSKKYQLGCWTHNEKRKQSSKSNKLNCSYLSTGEPTYWSTGPSRIPNLLDLFILENTGQRYLNIDVSLDLSSDHTSVIATISTHNKNGQGHFFREY